MFPFTAFIDRVDLKVHVGNPNLEARAMILRSALEELQRVAIVKDNDCDTYVEASDSQMFHDEHKHEHTISDDLSSKRLDSPSSLLSSCAVEAEGLSGRALRRLPLQAFSQSLGGVEGPVSTVEFLHAVSSAIRVEQQARESL